MRSQQIAGLLAAIVGASSAEQSQTREDGPTTEAVPSGVGSTSGDLTTTLGTSEGGGC